MLLDALVSTKHSAGLCHWCVLSCKLGQPARYPGLGAKPHVPHPAKRSARHTQPQLARAASTLQAPPMGGMTPTDGAHLAAAAERLPSVRAELTAAFRSALQTAYPAVEVEPVVSATNDARHGDYQCNNAMQLFGRLRGKEGAPKKPQDVAAAIIAGLPKGSLMLAGQPSMAGAGFINVRLSPAWVAQRIQAMLTQGIGPWAPRLPARRAVVDFSSPNVAKEMHVGHLRSTIIGDTIARTLEFCGVDTLRINHVGDWGTQFGMLIQHIAETRQGGLQGTTTEDVADLQALYKASKKRFDEEEDFKARAREAVTRLQAGDPVFEQTWERICEASRNEFDQLYKRLDVSIVWRGESFYNPRLAPLVDQLMQQGVAEESDGAQVIWVEGQKQPLMVRKSDGGFGYGTTDMAALSQRIHEEKADWLVYVTDEGQAGHFKLVFGAGRKAGIIPAERAPRIDHVGFGLVLGADGKRIRTRDSGAAVRLVELLDEARDKCAENIRARREEDIASGALSLADLDASAAVMGYGAVKYSDLKNNRMTNYKFSFEDMLDLRGNTAVYMLYAHARIASIIRKAGKDVAELAATAHISLDHPCEVALALQIVRFSEMLEDMLGDLLPNRITDYAYVLSDLFSNFYTECKVVGSEQEASRLLLCEATAVVMRQCFSLLGIKPLYRI